MPWLVSDTTGVSGCLRLHFYFIHFFIYILVDSLSLSLSHSLTHSLSLSHTLSLSLSLTHTLSLSHKLTHTFTLSQTLSLTLTHTFYPLVAVSLLLNTLNQLGLHSAKVTSFKASTAHTQTQTLDPTQHSTHHNNSAQHNTHHSAHTTTLTRTEAQQGSHTGSHPYLLPFALLPPDSCGVAEASLPLLEMAYSWLFSGMRSVPSELSAVLQGTVRSALDLHS